MPPTMNAALSALSAERSGSGSALISAMRQVGATIGVAMLGTVIGNGLPQPADRDAACPRRRRPPRRPAWSGGVQVAHRLGSAALLGSARSAFVHGMDIMLWVCGGIALGCAILAVIFLPRRPRDAGGRLGGDAGCAGGR